MQYVWVKGYEGTYRITLDGVVTSLHKEWRPLKTFIRPNGYRGVLLCSKGTEKKHSIHRLVAQAFIPNPEGLPEVHHKDNNKLNNSIENLEWVTREDNAKKAAQDGLMRNTFLRGEFHPNVVLTWKLVLIMRALHEIGVPYKTLAIAWDMPYTTVWSAATGRNWKWV